MSLALLLWQRQTQAEVLAVWRLQAFQAFQALLHRQRMVHSCVCRQSPLTFASYFSAAASVSPK